MKAVNVNHLWGTLIVEELVRSGVDYFVICPGSRSTPLAIAVAEKSECRQTVHFDERGAAFLALGYGKATGRPAAVICTSGTAAANFYPAIIEASQSRVPLIVLTADRPPELRDSGALQTIDQVKLFGSYARWFADVPTPSTEISPAYLLSTIDYAVAAASGNPAGPVHLNCMFREPLAPLGESRSFAEYLQPLTGWLKTDRPFTEYSIGSPLAATGDIARLAESLAASRRGVLVAGALARSTDTAAIIALADRLDWPLLADISSGVRFAGSAAQQIITQHDLYLRSEAITRRLEPDLILHFGAPPLSKSLQRYLTSSGAELVIVDSAPLQLDPMHIAGKRLIASPALVAQAWAAQLKVTPSPLLAAFRKLDEIAREQLSEAALGKAAELHELGIAEQVLRSASENRAVFVASSMSLRLAEMAAAVNGAHARVGANRGANGIDGTIATAIGFAAGAGTPVTLLIGDLATLHDLNSLALIRTADQPVTIVCLNNDGGGIFSHLPVAKIEAHFEEVFGTPHGRSLRAACDLFDIKFHSPKTLKDFATVYRASLKSRKSALIEVKTERAIEAAWLQKLWIRIEEIALRRLDQLVNS